MSAETEIVKITTEVRDAAITQAGFGTPMIVGSYPMSQRVLGPFASADELTEAPYSLATTHPVYLKAKALMAQTPSPSGFKIGKRALPATQIVELTPGTPAQGDVFSLKVGATAVSVTAAATPTVASIVTALTADIDAIAGVTAADNTTHVTVTADTAGALVAFEDLSSNLKVKQATVDAGIVTDLAAVGLADSKGSSPGYYGLLIDAVDEATIKATAAWAETQEILYLACSSDSGMLDASVTDDVASALRTAGYHRTIISYHTKPVTQAFDAAWMGRMFPKLPGQATWFAQRIAGVDALKLSAAERAALEGKNCNYLHFVGGNPWSKNGLAASGRFIDITRTVDWFVARLRESILKATLDRDKIAQTDKDTQIIAQLFFALISTGVKNGAINGEVPPTIDIPLIEEISANDRAARILKTVRFTFRLAGAFHKFEIEGSVGV